MAEPPPTYTREEMDAILKRAIERQQARAEGIGHEDLVEAAGEVGIPREEVEAAAREIEAEKAKRGAAAPPNAAAPASPEQVAEDDDRARALRALKRRAVTFFGLSMFFFLIGRETFGASWWIWPVFGMGVSLVIHASRVLFADPTPGGRSAERRPSRRERRRMRREQRLADFERKVAIGTDALIRVIEEAKKVKLRAEEAASRPSRPEAGPRVLVTPPPVRVDAREREEVEEGGTGERGARGRERR
jgi:hypothetical protein